MKWKREETKKYKAKAKVDMYLVSFCLCGLTFAFVVYTLEGHLVSFLFWPRILMGMLPSIISLHLAKTHSHIRFRVC